MKIPLFNKKTPKPPLELLSLRLYSITRGKKPIYTTHFFRAFNENFGIEAKLQNNTDSIQNVKLGACIYNSNGEVFAKSIHIQKFSINPHSNLKRELYISPKLFSSIKDGNYRVQVWINDETVNPIKFTVSYK